MIYDRLTLLFRSFNALTSQRFSLFLLKARYGKQNMEFGNFEGWMQFDRKHMYLIRKFWTLKTRIRFFLNQQEDGYSI